ncbi:glycosyltransferase family 2 protein [Candidatus Woesearchaeota archaeon]|nr:glycosyltransferase family 2 protein [Candidatus Woesearchaeota archaeon]
MNLSVIVPCYNEGKNISLIVRRFNEIKPKGLDVELILVDNGSNDDTHEQISLFVRKYTYIKLVTVKKNIGYGFGILTGLKNAKGEYLCWTHADMQTDLNDTIKAYNLIVNQKNSRKIFVRGNRKGRPLFSQFFTWGMSIFESLLLGQFLWEINAQPKLFHSSYMNKIKNPPNDWSLDLYFYYLAKKNNFEINSIDVIFPERIHGKSHWDEGIKSKIKFIKRTIDFSLKLKKTLINKS